MIRKLRFKFILLTMSVLLAVLVVIIGGINMVNYTNVVNNADSVLSLLSENEGRFPKNNAFPRRPNREMSPELPFESRFFSVLLDGDGQILQTETGNIAAVDAESAIAMAQTAAAKKSGTGFLGDYRYQKVQEGTRVRIIFLDCGRSLESFRTFLFASILISLCGFLVVLAVVTLLSGRIMRPFAESYEKQKRFITDAGHELKTPLTIIGADVDILAMDQGENEWLSDIQKQVKQLTGLTNDLVFLSRMEEADTPMQKLPFPLSDVVSETAASFQALAQAQGKTFTTEISPMLTLDGDEKSIAQLVRLLLDNALKYSPEGGSVSLALEKYGRQCRLSVSNTTDNPLPLDNLKALFERFYRADPSRNSQTGGHGIGLSVAKAIVTAHGGKIQATSEDGHSLCITAFLPM